MKKKQFGMCRNPKTHRANRDNQDRQYVRGKRCSLPSAWDLDYWIGEQKSWKGKRKTQYRTDGRGKKHEVIIGTDVCEWKLEEYFQDNNIPFSIEMILKRVVKYIKKPYGYMKDYGSYYDEDMGWVSNYQKWIFTHYETEEWVRHYRIGYEVTWWSDKDIGIDYLLNRFRLI